MTEPDPESVFDVLNSDHRAIAEQLTARPVAADSEPDGTGEAGDAAREQLVMDLVRHFVAEEQYLYPTVRDRIPDGSAIADEAFRSHRDCEAELRVLERQDASESEIAAVLASVAAQFDVHVRKQQNLFTQLKAALSSAEAIELGEQVLGSEQVAPTRPRTLASESAGLNKAESLVEGFIDRVRDAYSHRGVDGSN
ncbi:MAG: Hemerythrin cation binding domain protein [Frankiales bacterium]|nr:Hemerythrin cation binding domain protein [Frankiales bacterium]